MKVTQRNLLLHALRDAKEQGLNSYVATYEMRIKQAPTRIKELRELGYTILSKKNNDRSVNWILLEKPQPVYKWEFDSHGNCRQVVVG